MIAESENYCINTCKITNDNLLIRKSDNSFCYITDKDVNMLVELVDDLVTFDEICSTYVFMNPMLEKADHALSK